MSKERARRRAVREAEAAASRAARQRVVRRRDRRRAMLRRIRPRLPDRRTGRLFARRTRAQRAAIVVAALMALGIVWFGLDSWLGLDSLGTKVALSVLILVATPAVTVLVFDRRI